MSISKKVMIDYLNNHFKYYTMNSWNKTESYARNVKIHNIIPLDSGVRDKAYTAVFEGMLPSFIYHMIENFETENDCEIFFNGRSGGYLVLTKKGEYTLREYPEDLSTDDLKYVYKLVKDFDKLVDNIIKDFIEFLKKNEIRTEEVEVLRTETRIRWETL